MKKNEKVDIPGEHCKESILLEWNGKRAIWYCPHKGTYSDTGEVRP